MRKSIRYRHAHARRKQLRRLSVEQCESRYCLSAIGFAPHDIVTLEA